MARTDPYDLSRTATATELIVQRSQAVEGDAQVWVFIGETENTSRLTVAAESVPRLRASLP